MSTMPVTMSASDLALSLRTCGEFVSLGGLAGLLASANLRVLSLRAESAFDEKAGVFMPRWAALVSLIQPPPSGPRGSLVAPSATEGTGETIAHALAAACDKLVASASFDREHGVAS